MYRWHVVWCVAFPYNTASLPKQTIHSSVNITFDAKYTDHQIYSYILLIAQKILDFEATSKRYGYVPNCILIKIFPHASEELEMDKQVGAC